MARIKRLSQNTAHEKALEKAKKFIAAENYVDAKEEVERVLDSNPTDDRALNLLAIIMLKLEQFNRAVKIYEELIARYPQTVSLRTNLGVAYLKNNQQDESIKEFTFVLQKEPDNKTILKLYGKALLQLGKKDEAIEMFTRAGMEDYVKKIQKGGTSESVESDLSTDDMVQDAMDKDRIHGDHGAAVVLEPGAQQEPEHPEEAAHAPEAPPEAQPQAPAEPLAVQPAEEPAIETERGPSATDEQEFMNEQYTAENEHPAEQAAASEELPGEQVREQPREHQDEQSPHPAQEAEHTTGQEQPVSGEAQTAAQETPPITHQEEQPSAQPQEQEPAGEQPADGLRLLADQTALLRASAPVRTVSDALLLFNLNGTVVYVRDKGIVSLAESLTIEPAYKRYRGKDTKSLFAEKKDDPVVLVYGKGTVVLRSEYAAVRQFNLKNESMFFDDERLVAFQGDLEWENGRVEIQTDKTINVTQIRGAADVFIGVHDSLHSIRVSADQPVSVKLSTLVGWYGKLIPRQSSVRHSSNGNSISFHGEGVVFIDA